MVYTDRAGQQRQELPARVVDPLREVLGDIAAVFADHDGFTLKAFQKGGYPPVWSVHQSSRLDLWSGAMLDSMTAYADRQQEYEAALAKAARSTDEKNKTEASDLWGQA